MVLRATIFVLESFAESLCIGSKFNLKSRCQAVFQVTDLNQPGHRGRPATGAAHRVVAGDGRAHHLEAVRRHRARSLGSDRQQDSSDVYKPPQRRSFSLAHVLALSYSPRSPSLSQ